jgi:autophagy-related protein 5
MEKRISLGAIQKTIWDGRIPLEIILDPSESRTFDKTDPYLVCLWFSEPTDDMALIVNY